MRFRVDVATFRRIGAELLEATAVVHEIEHDRDALIARVADAGHDGVRHSGSRFVDEWAFGARCLARDAETLAGLLISAEAAYVEIDDAIVSSWLYPDD